MRTVVFPYDGYEHLGIGYLATVAQQARWKASLVPVNFGDYITGYHQIKSDRILAARDDILAIRPNIVAFSLVSPSAGPMIRLARAIRHAGIKTLAGGPHATVEPEQTLNSGAFDALVQGEADLVIATALDTIFFGHKPLPTWLHTPLHKPTQFAPVVDDLDNLPIPAKDLFYEHNPEQSDDYLVLASRGCPYRCIYCCVPRLHTGLKVRRRTPGSLLNELTVAKHLYSPKSIYFMDDMFITSRRWLHDFLVLYKSAVGLPFHAICHPLYLDTDIAQLLSHSGCFALRIGVQTLTPHVRNRLGRPENSDDVFRAIDSAKKAGIRVEIDHMLDLPGETLDDVRNAIIQYSRHRPDAIKVYWLMPLPGTPWFNEAQVEGRLSVELAKKMRRGEGFGTHSYLFYQGNYSNRRWLGVHVLLALTPDLWPSFLRFLIKLKADQFLCLPSFLVVVGLSRILTIVKGWDSVGKGHLRKFLRGLFS